jgi:YfiH family protein
LYLLGISRPQKCWRFFVLATGSKQKLQGTRPGLRDAKEAAMKQSENYGLTLETKNSIEYYISRRLYENHAVLVVFSTRLGGVSPAPYKSLNLALHVGDSESNVIKNREKLCEIFGVDSSRLVCAEQVHGIQVAVVGEEDAGKGSKSLDSSIRGVDALITARESLPLALFFADCVPIVLVDPIKRAIGVVHAGWRGIYRNIIRNAINKMAARWLIDVGDLIAFIGPSIGGCCYEVGYDLVHKFAGQFANNMEWLNGERRIDLRKLAVTQLLQSGIMAKSIYVCEECCTACQNKRFFSYRADGNVTGRQTALAALLQNRVV